MTEEKILNSLNNAIGELQRDCWENIQAASVSDIQYIADVSQKGKRKWRKYASCAAVLAVFLGGGLYFNPCSYVALDINPSIELETNAFNKVISVQGVNEEGKSVVAELSLMHKNVGDATRFIVEEAIERGYLGSEKDNAIVIGIGSQKEKKEIQIEQVMREEIDRCLKSSEIDGYLLSQHVQSDQVIREKAHQFGVSESRWILVEAVAAIDPSVSIESLTNKSMGDIIAYIQEKHLDVEQIEEQVEERYGIDLEDHLEKIGYDLDDEMEDDEDSDHEEDDDVNVNSVTSNSNVKKPVNEEINGKKPSAINKEDIVMKENDEDDNEDEDDNDEDNDEDDEDDDDDNKYDNDNEED